MKDKIRRLHNDTRCSRCNRFIPSGFDALAKDDNAVECVTHPHNLTVLDKGGYSVEVSNELAAQRQPTRRQAVMAEVKESRQQPLRMEFV